MHDSRIGFDDTSLNDSCITSVFEPHDTSSLNADRESDGESYSGSMDDGGSIGDQSHSQSLMALKRSLGQ